MTSLQAADAVIAALLPEYDYQHKRQEIADLFEHFLWNGNWDCQTHFDDDTLDLRFIQEDEFDQHSEETEYEVFAAGHYIQIVY